MDRISELLEKTSRTFAVAIPFLPEPIQRQVAVSYLLFRVADTLEDADRWKMPQRMAELGELEVLLKSPGAKDASRALSALWLKNPPCDHPGYLELLAELPAVIAAFEAFPNEVRELIRSHLLRTCRGMASFLARADERGSLRLNDLEDLRVYCYTVAGLIGELLTGLFVCEAQSLRRIEALLNKHARAFGEGLQLVNILKDADSDARVGRVYLPRSVPRADIFDLAQRDLRSAAEYVLGLQEAGADDGIVAFTAFPVMLARTTLDRVKHLGAGAKVTRAEVAEQIGALQQALVSKVPVLTLT